MRVLFILFCGLCCISFSLEATDISEYEIEESHPAKSFLDELFLESDATECRETLLKAGFEIIAEGKGSFVTVAKHPSLPGYLFKLYLESETRRKEKRADESHTQSLINRCIGAKKLRDLIHREGFIHFTVPDKWLYLIPGKEEKKEPILLVVTDMQILSEEATEQAWQEKVSKSLLKELFAILERGYGSTALISNVPYTKEAKFAFVDTEYPKRSRKLEKVKKQLSPQMQSYWEEMLRAARAR